MQSGDEKMLKMETIQTAIALLGLCLNSVTDVIKKEISIKFTVFCAVCGVILRAVAGFDVKDLAIALLPGLICVLLCFATREQIGFGDAWILLATGCCISGVDLAVACMLSLAGAGLVAIFLCVVLHKKGTFEFPFVPFVFAGVVCVRCIGL
jgi:prepilin signal peptidase PulO-like enzyme (type II secretory pathway)